MVENESRGSATPGDLPNVCQGVVKDVGAYILDRFSAKVEVMSFIDSCFYLF